MLLTIIQTILVGYVIQMMVACIFNILNNITPPTNKVEFVLLTFLPYTIFKAWDVMLKQEQIDSEIIDNNL